MKKMEIKTNKAYEAPECVITRFALEMSVMSPATPGIPPITGEDDNNGWN